MITIEQMVQREVLCCMSSLISNLAKGQSHLDGCMGIPEIDALSIQASELAGPVLDYEEAATQAGWKRSGPYDGYFHFAKHGQRTIFKTSADAWQEICEHDGIDPYEWEVYEHWAVTQWLADKLIAQGERVDTDFVGLNIWARTTTGQAIAMDGCIARIYADMMALHTLDSVATGA